MQIEKALMGTEIEPNCPGAGRGGGGTPLQEANRDVPLDGVAFSRLDWL